MNFKPRQIRKLIPIQNIKRIAYIIILKQCIRTQREINVNRNEKLLVKIFMFFLILNVFCLYGFFPYEYW